MCGFLAVKSEDPEVMARAGDAAASLYYRGLEGPEYRGMAIGNQIQFFHYSLPLVTNNLNLFSQPRQYNGRPFVFVGEIFNWEQLAKDLKWKCDSDIDLIGTAMCRDQDELATALHLTQMFDGFWSAAWSPDLESLVGMTDHLGIKPLYYRRDIRALSSEPVALTKLAPVTKNEVFRSNIQKWGYDPTGLTPWNEILQLPPGCIYLNGSIIQYYDIKKTYADISSVQDEDVLVTMLEELILEAVEARMVSTRSVGILLSGGLDSSIVYSAARSINPYIQAFHVPNHEEEYAELMHSVGDYVEQPPLISLGKTKVSREEAMIIHQSPVDLGSVKPQIALGRALRNANINVVMTGDGADELFGGYTRDKDYDSQHSDVFCELPYYHNPRLDRTMMYHTVETRSPFLSPKIVSFALQLPRHLRRNKEILRRVARRNGVPDSIVDRKKVALKTDGVRANLLMETKLNLEVFDRLKIERLDLTPPFGTRKQ